MDVVVMAAAVADYTPAERAGQKVAKDGDTLTLVLKKTPDILGELGQRRVANGRRAAARRLRRGDRGRRRARDARSASRSTPISSSPTTCRAPTPASTSTPTPSPSSAPTAPRRCRCSRSRASRRRSSIASKRCSRRGRPTLSRTCIVDRDQLNEHLAVRRRARRRRREPRPRLARRQAGRGGSGPTRSRPVADSSPGVTHRSPT